MDEKLYVYTIACTIPASAAIRPSLERSTRMRKGVSVSNSISDIISSLFALGIDIRNCLKLDACQQANNDVVVSSSGIERKLRSDLISEKLLLTHRRRRCSSMHFSDVMASGEIDFKSSLDCVDCKNLWDEMDESFECFEVFLHSQELKNTQNLLSATYKSKTMWSLIWKSKRYEEKSR